MTSSARRKRVDVALGDVGHEALGRARAASAASLRPRRAAGRPRAPRRPRARPAAGGRSGRAARGGARPGRAARRARASRPARRRRRARRRASTPCARRRRRWTPRPRRRRARAPGAVLERELLELAQEPLLALADLGDQRLGARPCRARGRARARGPATQRGSSHGLTPLSSAIVAAGLLDRLAQPVGRPCCGPPRGRRRRSSASRRPCPSCAAATCSTSASFQRSTPSAMTKRRPMANVIVAERGRDVVGGARVALEHLDAARAGSRPPPARAACARRSAMRPWSSPRIEVGGLEGGHGGRV